VWGLLVAGAVSGGCGPAKPVEARQYQFDCQIIKRDDAGGKKVMAEPRLVTQAGRPASFLIGGEVVAPAADKKVQFIETGLRMEMRVLEEKGGKLRLDVTAQDIRPETGAGGSVRTRTRSARAIEVLEPKESLKLKVGPYTFKVQAQPIN
jgi:hypothetical protein